MRRWPRLILVLIGAWTLFTGCAARQRLVPVNDQTVQLTPNTILEASVASVAAKRGGYFFKVNLRNISFGPVLIYLAEMNCYRGTRPGTLKHTLFNRDERVLRLDPNQVLHLEMDCRHAEGPEGEFRIGIPKVYAQAKDGGEGKVVARGLSLVIAPDGGPSL